jgi:CrcB protein
LSFCDATISGHIQEPGCGAGNADVIRPVIPFAAMGRSSQVFAGGLVGTLARAGVAEGISSPWCTLLVNVLGAALLGYVVAALPQRRALLGTGFCGGLTTFSTLQLEALNLSTLDAVLYLAGSALAGWAAVALGRRLA